MPLVTFDNGPERGELIDLDAAGMVNVGLLEKIEQLFGIVVVWMLVPAASDSRQPPQQQYECCRRQRRPMKASKQARSTAAKQRAPPRAAVPEVGKHGLDLGLVEHAVLIRVVAIELLLQPGLPRALHRRFPHVTNWLGLRFEHCSWRKLQL